MVVCFGELIVDFTPEGDCRELERAELFRRHVGGAPANVAIGLHKHGVPVQLWSRVGDDSFGRFLVQKLSTWGMEVSHIQTDAAHPTRLAWIGWDEQGDRYFEFHNRDSADRHIARSIIDREALNRARIFHFGGVGLIGEETAATTFEIVETVHSQNGWVSFDPNIRLELCQQPEILKERIHRILPQVDILKMSEQEFHQLFPEKEPGEIVDSGISLLVITRGGQGSELWTSRHRVKVPAHPVSVVDPTGAGDAYMAAMLSRLYHFADQTLSTLAEDELRQVGEFASRWAAIIVSYPGAVQGYFVPHGKF
jgi:fructokinase